MIQFIGPALQAAFLFMKGDKKNLANKAGVDEGAFDSVIGAVQDYLTKDERAQKFWAEQMDNARQHDIATFDQGDKFINRLRSSVRPIVTFVALAWYVYARLNNIPLTQEDYTIIGGVLAFWFGFRPFEKRQR